MPKRTSKDLSLLSDKWVKCPVDPKEAREWLAQLATYLEEQPNLSPRFRFIAEAIRVFLTGSQRLSHALGLVPPRKAPRRGRPAMPAETVTKIVSALRRGESPRTIAKAIGVGKDTVETIRAEMHKATLTAPASERAEDGDVRPAEWEAAKKRASEVRPERLAPIIEGLANNIKLSDLIDVPTPVNRYAQQSANPKHKPNRLRRKSK
jgi:hypothetical protein